MTNQFIKIQDMDGAIHALEQVNIFLDRETDHLEQNGLPYRDLESARFLIYNAKGHLSENQKLIKVIKES